MIPELNALTPEETQYQNDISTQQPAGEAEAATAAVAPSADDKATEAQTAVEKPPQGYVPIQALHQERELKKQLRREMQELRKFNETQSSLYQELRQQLEGLRGPKAPDPSEDPWGYIQHQNTTLQEQVQTLSQRDAQYQQAQQMQAEQQRILAQYRDDAVAFSSTAKDFSAAYQHLMQSRVSEYEALGYNRAQALEMLHNDELNIVRKALEDDVSPAERIYNLAKVRGYNAENAKTDVGSQSRQGFSQSAANGQDAQAKLRAVKEGLESASAINKVSEKAGESSNLEKLLSLSDKDFDSAWEKLFPKQ